MANKSSRIFQVKNGTKYCVKLTQTKKKTSVKNSQYFKKVTIWFLHAALGNEGAAYISQKASDHNKGQHAILIFVSKANKVSCSRKYCGFYNSGKSDARWTRCENQTHLHRVRCIPMTVQFRGGVQSDTSALIQRQKNKGSLDIKPRPH